MPVKMIVTYRRQNRKEAAIRRHRSRYFFSQGRQGQIDHLLSCRECFDWRCNIVDKVDLYNSVVR